MSKKATEFRKKEMSKMFRGKEIFEPLNTESDNTEEAAKVGFLKGVGR